MPTTRCVTSVCDAVLDEGRIARVLEAGGEAPGQTDHPVGGAQQQRAGVRS